MALIPRYQQRVGNLVGGLADADPFPPDHSGRVAQAFIGLAGTVAAGLDRKPREASAGSDKQGRAIASATAGEASPQAGGEAEASAGQAVAGAASAVTPIIEAATAAQQKRLHCPAACP